MNNNKRKKLEELQEIARRMTITALAEYDLPDDYRRGAVLGTQWDGEDCIFELYLPGERPADAKVFARTRLNSRSGRGQTQILGLNKRSA